MSWRAKIPYSVGLYVEEILLALFLLVDLWDFIAVMPPDVQFFDKIIAWSLMAYLLYSTHLSTIFFGVKNKLFDTLFLIGMYLFSFKGIIQVLHEVQTQEPYYVLFYEFLLSFAPELQKISFYLAGLLFIALALWMGSSPMKKTSVFGVLGITKNSSYFRRTSTAFFMLSAFFLIFFNLMIEWIAMIEDDIIAVISILLFIDVVRKYRYKLQPKTILFSLNELYDKFHTTFMQNLARREKILVVMSGMLVLHMLTDVIVFVIPLLFGGFIPNFGTEGIYHFPLLELIKLDSTHAVWYSLNALTLILLMVAPALIWYFIYTDRKERVHIAISSVALLLLIPFTFFPSYQLASINSTLSPIIGVDLGSKFITSFSLYPLIAMALVIFFAALFRTRLERKYLFVALFGMLLFMIQYFYLFLRSFLMYYKEVIFTVPPFLGFFLLIFACITALFYVGGVCYFVYAIEKEFDFI